MPIEGIETVGLRIRHARKLRKLNQEQLAKAAGIKQPSLSELESGATKEISGPVLIAISGTLHVRPEWVVTGAEPIEADPAHALSDEELELLKLYRNASGMWKLAIKYVANMKLEEQREKATTYLLSMVTATPVPDSRLGDNWTRPDKRKK